MVLSRGNRPALGSPNLWALAAFMLCLWLGGGASRGDVAGQVVVRSVSWMYLVAIALFGVRPSTWRGRAVLWLLLAAVALVVAQLTPLPPTLWSHLPGRELFATSLPGAAALPWRPLALVPSAAINAAYSLVVPAVVYLLIAAMPPTDDGRLVAIVLGGVAAAMLLGLIQLAGVPLRNPLVNAGDQAAGPFANRNHFALFLAFGCLLAPVWAFHDRSRMTWRAVGTLALIPLLLLTILASGSRAGVALGLIGLAGGLAVAWQSVRAALCGRTRWTGPALATGFLVLIVFLVFISVSENRASSISRVMAFDVEGDMRTRALPTVWAMIRTYFPVGEGFGGFDILFRLHEPHHLLKPTYFNRVHDDFLEVVLDGGLAGAVLLAVGMAWWLRATVYAWHSQSNSTMSRLGSVMILMIAVASVFDYPARTPIIMACLVISGVWLSGATEGGGRSSQRSGLTSPRAAREAAWSAFDPERG